MGELRVDRDAQHLAVQLVELRSTVAESYDLRGAHKGKVQRVEKEDHVLPWGKGWEETRSWGSGPLRPYQFSSVAQSCPTLQPNGLQHASLPFPGLKRI